MLQYTASVNRNRKMSDETVEMDASISVYSGNSESSPSNVRRQRRFDVTELLDLNCDVLSVDSMLVNASFDICSIAIATAYNRPLCNWPLAFSVEKDTLHA
jgi:hypothetical protein